MRTGIRWSSENRKGELSERASVSLERNLTGKRRERGIKDGPNIYMYFVYILECVFRIMPFLLAYPLLGFTKTFCSA